MVEPPNVGFTGKVWDAIPAERLARDLTTGSGPVPMADAAAAWTNLAAGLGSAAAEYESIMGLIGQAWGSRASEDSVEKMRELRDWFTRTAEAAAANAGRVGYQAGAYEIARATMPDLQDIAAAQTTANGLVHGGLLGAPLTGALSSIDGEINVAKSQAARVMQTYEAATAPLAQPWPQEHPPVISADKALAAERARTEHNGRTSIQGGPPPGANLPALNLPTLDQIHVHLTQTAYSGEQLAQPVQAAVPTPAPVHAGAVPAQAVAGPTPTMAPAVEEDHVTRIVAAVDQSEIDRLWVSAGFATAPAVLGGTAVAPTPHQIAPIAQAAPERTAEAQ